MGRISSLLLVAALLELLEALLAGGRLSPPEGPGRRQSQDTRAQGRGKWMAALGDSQGRSLLTALFIFAGERSSVLCQCWATVPKMGNTRISRELFQVMGSPPLIPNP